jgi:hypothetical protein
MRKQILAGALALLLPAGAIAQYPSASVIRPLDVRPLPARAYWAQPLPLTVPNTYYGPRLSFYTPTYTFSDWYGNNYLPPVGGSYYYQPAPGVTVQVR